MNTCKLFISFLSVLILQISCISQPKPPLETAIESNACGRRINEVHRLFSLSQSDCSDQLSVKEWKKLIPNFPISEGILRRANFWKKVYSHYDTNEIILHSSEYPEVVLETTTLKEKISRKKQKRANKTAAKYLKVRSLYYKSLLLGIHKKDPRVEKDPNYERILEQFSHINDKNKYLKASRALRTQRGLKTFIQRGIHSSQPYMQHIEAEFESRGLPRELAYLSFVESTFDIHAKSQVGATGIFQIMALAGRPYMHISKRFDERRDPIKSAKVAAILLEQNFQALNSWPLAITAYNHGPTSILNMVRKKGTSNIEDLWYESYRNFGFASKNFYAEFIGILMALKTAPEHFELHPKKAVGPFKTVTTRRKVRIKKFAQRHRISLEDLKKLNPDISKRAFKYNNYIPKNYQVKIPEIREIGETLDHSSADNMIMETYFSK